MGTVERSPAATRPEGEERAAPAGPAATPAPPTGTGSTTRCERKGRPAHKGPLPQSGGGHERPPSLKALEVVGAYQVLKRLGVGGMAEVYVARTAFGAGLEKLCALKIVHEEFGASTEFGALFTQEAKLSVSLQHPNLIHVFDLGESAGRAFLAMEYVHGRSLNGLLKALLARGTPVAPSFAVKVVLELCNVLEYLHDKRDLDGRPLNLVHRDVNANNVLVSERGEVKLVDFGVASASVLETLGLVVGTSGWVSPEQARGGVPEPSWDIYSLGVLLRRLLELPSDLDPAVRGPLMEVVGAATARRQERLRSAREMRAQLEGVEGALRPFDLEGMVREVFGPSLLAERRELETLVASGRKRMPRTTGNDLPKLGLFSDLRRRLATTRLALEIARHPRVAWAALALLASWALIAGGLAVHGWAIDRVVERNLAAAEAQMDANRLIEAEGALDHLLAAQSARPDEPRVRARLSALAAALEGQGAKAERQGNFPDATIYFQAALRAAPNRPGMQQRIETLEKRIRDEGAKRTHLRR